MKERPFNFKEELDKLKQLQPSRTQYEYILRQIIGELMNVNMNDVNNIYFYLYKRNNLSLESRYQIKVSYSYKGAIQNLYSWDYTRKDVFLQIENKLKEEGFEPKEISLLPKYADLREEKGFKIKV